MKTLLSGMEVFESSNITGKKKKTFLQGLTLTSIPQESEIYFKIFKYQEIHINHLLFTDK